MGVTEAAVAGLIISAIGTGVAVHQSAEARQDTRRAQKKASMIDQRRAELENQRNARRAIAARRVQQAELIASAQPGQVGANSALSGAVGSLTTQTAANIGFANQQLAADVGIQRALFRGQKKADRHELFAGMGQAAAQIGMSMMSYGGSGTTTTGAYTGQSVTSPSRASLINQRRS